MENIGQWLDDRHRMLGNLGFRYFGTNKVNIWGLEIKPYDSVLSQEVPLKALRKYGLCQSAHAAQEVRALCDSMHYKCHDKVDYCKMCCDRV